MRGFASTPSAVLPALSAMPHTTQVVLTAENGNIDFFAWTSENLLPGGRVRVAAHVLAFQTHAAVFALAAAHADNAWRDLVVAPEHRRSPYDRGDYPYPQSVEHDIVATFGGRIYGNRPATSRVVLACI